MRHTEKLVRDKIPAIIRAQGKEPVVRAAGCEERRDLLRAKLQEEVAEFLAAPDIGHPLAALAELVDILEVVRALSLDLGFSPEELERARVAKAETRGGFHRGFVWGGNAGER